MASPEIVDYARSFAVMVRVQGPDPKGLKMRDHAFHQYHSGKTTLSASGMLLPDMLYDSEVAKHLFGQNDQCSALVLTLSSVFEPFLPLHQRGAIPQGRPELIPGALIPGAEIDIMIEGKISLKKDMEELEKGAPSWLAAKLLALIDVPASSIAIQSLIDASLGSTNHGWEVGWSLVSRANDSQSSMDAFQNQRHLVEEESSKSPRGKLTSRIAILGVSLLYKDMPNITISTSNERGTFLLAVGSPFGVLSPLHFFNSLSAGSISNCYPPNLSCKSLLMADIRCLPGMEGSPVFDEQAHLIGILIRPLRQNSSGVEIQLVIPWEAIASACSDLLQKEPQNSGKGNIDNDKGNLNAVGEREFITNMQESDGPFSYIRDDHKYGSPLVEKAMASICLITIDDGVWASGVLLNSEGLILTNAHLLEPWRFGKTNISIGRFGTSEHENYQTNSVYTRHSNIRVRLVHMKPWIWCDAKVIYVCKGPLDVALLQLRRVPDEVSPIIVDFKWPLVGSKAYVIGYGLFGPKSGFLPSVSSGVVANVVKANIPISYPSFQQGDRLGHIPAMIETTAAVHPGSSGGAVVNSDGHMIGLVTSNTRHGGGTIIPHLNFSIPCAAMMPIFMFSKDMQDNSLLQILDQPDEHLSSVWALVPPISPRPPPSPNLPPSLVEDNNEGKKGSRFAKFIAERHKLFKNSNRLDKTEGGSTSTNLIPSKL